MVKDLQSVRNIGLISHGGVGKTTLTDTLLYNCGLVDRLGRVDDENSNSDFLPEEKKRRISINSSFFTLPVDDCQLNLIDTPGYGDLAGDVKSSLRIVDGALLMCCALSGVQVNTRRYWEYTDQYQLPRMVMINKLDREDSSFEQTLEDLRENFDAGLTPLVIPIGSGDDFKGVVDLLQKKAYLYQEDGSASESDIPDEMASAVEEMSMELLENLVETDEELMMKYLEDEEISFEELQSALREAVIEGEMVPVVAGSAVKNIGLDLLLSYMASVFPSPLEVEQERVTEVESGEEVILAADKDAPLAALVAKTMVDPYVGRLNVVRVYSGQLTPDQEIYNVNRDEKEKVGKIFQLFGQEQENLEAALPGQIVALGKLSVTKTGDSLASSDRLVQFPDLDLPRPSLPLAVQPESEGDEEKISTALSRYAEEDPTFTVHHNAETKELIITCMGQLHIDIARDISQRKFGIGFVTSVPRVAYKETLQKKVDVEEKYKKQSGGRGQYGHVYIKVEPLPRGQGFVFEEDIFGGAIPNQYIPAVEKGIEEAMQEGVLAGYPVVDVKATCYDGSYHSVDSSEMAFKIAASKAFKKAMKNARPVLLEPIMEIEVTVPEQFMGDIIGDLNGKRGKILGMEPVGKKQIIKAQAPQAEIFSYATDLKSITGGQGSFDMEFSFYDKVPPSESEDIISQEDTA